MRTLLGALCILAAACAGASWARDPSTPPALGDPPDGSEKSPAASSNRAQDRYESETRPKSDEMLATAVHDSLSHDTRVNAMKLRVSADRASCSSMERFPGKRSGMRPRASPVRSPACET